jgi:hypothetical protein
MKTCPWAHILQEFGFGLKTRCDRYLKCTIVIRMPTKEKKKLEMIIQIY